MLKQPRTRQFVQDSVHQHEFNAPVNVISSNIINGSQCNVTQVAACKLSITIPLIIRAALTG